ncbi:hypothetical protein HY501_01320 [Candidatus Woesearchaeota archaeon]|nr:hypothetical protein [Candidatus Woesearchaeota archaeon]
MGINIKLNIKQKFASAGSIFSSIASFLGGYQVCHNICLGIVALLSIVGITVTGMPLLFLTKIAVPFWIAAFSLFVLALVLYIWKKCISKKLLLFNAGILIAGIPFQSLQKFNLFFWIGGGYLILTSLALLIMERIKKREVKCH